MANSKDQLTELTQIKSWEELTLADNFIFQKFMMNEKICKRILSEILGKEVNGIEYPTYEKTIDVRRDSKGIRLDVYIKGENEVYNIEMQNININVLPKRGRYYGDLIDIDLLQKGMDYTELCHSYVIFICSYDFYQKNQYKYTFSYKCDEVVGLEYGDSTTQIVLNTQGSEGNVSEDLKIFLNCINGVFSDDEFSATIKTEVEQIKSSQDCRREYMTLELELREQFRAGKAKGHAEAKSKDINILKSLKSGMSIEDTASMLNVPIEEVQELYELTH